MPFLRASAVAVRGIITQAPSLSRPAVSRNFSRAAAQTMEGGPVQLSITEKLQTLKPQVVEVINESYMHNVPKGSETHFKVVIVSEQFQGKGLVQRHRMVHQLLQEELAGPVHALSVHCKTSEQWEKEGGAKSVGESPRCLGGNKK